MIETVIEHVFVYGTLRPGDVRWHFLAQFVDDEGHPDSVPGRLFDTGFDYPAAMFGGNEAADSPMTIHGQTLRLRRATIDRALEVLDEVEGIVDGDYHRVSITTDRGVTAWAYASGSSFQLTPIDSGDWFLHRPLP